MIVNWTKTQLQHVNALRGASPLSLTVEFLIEHLTAILEETWELAKEHMYGPDAGMEPADAVSAAMGWIQQTEILGADGLASGAPWVLAMWVEASGAAWEQVTGL